MAAPILISIESSSAKCSVAVLSNQNNHATVVQSVYDGEQEHAAHLLPMLDSLLQNCGINKTQLSGIVFGQGPGGFTGLRVACGVAQGIALGLNLKVLPVNSLYALAWAQREKANGSLIACVLDARMGEVYMGVYQYRSNDDTLEEWQSPCLIAAGDVLPWLKQFKNQLVEKQTIADCAVYVCGDGLKEYATTFDVVDDQIVLGDNGRADAAVLAQVGLHQWDKDLFCDPEYAMPLYVRDKVAFTSSEREQGMGGNPKAAIPSFVKSDNPFVAAYEHAMSVHHDVLLKAMTESDLAQVASIEQEVAHAPWTFGMFSDALKAGYGAWVLCHTSSNQVLGFALQMFGPDVSELLLVGVAKTEQSKGYGQILVNYTQLQAAQRHIKEQVLEVRPSNVAANRLYAKAGYIKVGERRAYYQGVNGEREDALVLQKKW